MTDTVDVNDLIEQGNEYRNSTQPDKALECYAQAFVKEPTNPHAWNNYGNVLREMGYPARAIPFLQHAVALVPDYITAQFNLSVAYMLMGDLKRGLEQYEWRWQYEHLANTKYKFSQPEWNGEDLTGKTILVCWEQGLGDTIQFYRFLKYLTVLGAKVTFHTHQGMQELFEGDPNIDRVITDINDAGEFDYWVMTMSVPRVLGVTYETLPKEIGYIEANPYLVEQWRIALGPKTKMRIGVCWSGRKDSWINQHKAMPLELMIQLAELNPDIEWVSLQADASPEELELLNNSSAFKKFPGYIRHWGDTAAVVANMDMVISVDTAIAHLAGAMGKDLWIPLNLFAVDWRYLLNTGISPWYPTARIFRQATYGDWIPVLEGMHRFLDKVRI